MTTLYGRCGSPGVAFGVLTFYHRPNGAAALRRIADVDKEILRFEAARKQAAAQLAQLAVDSAEKLGEENASVFEIHQMMLEDDEFYGEVHDRIRLNHICAEHAVSKTAERFAALFGEIEDEYMRGRAADVRDMANRVISVLAGEEEDEHLFHGQRMLVAAADDFSPSETAKLDKSTVMAMAVRGGSPGSHSAIFARTMGIPCVCALGRQLLKNHEGKQVAVDGEEGLVYIEPDMPTMKALIAKQDEQRRLRALYEPYRGRETRTRDGREIKLMANIGSVADCQYALGDDAEGIGLFRSEFLFLGAASMPGEEEQYEVYKEAAVLMQGRPVIIRTLDIGADKRVDYLDIPHEENPAMGMRAIRASLQTPEVFKTQLRAILRASVAGRLQLMLPMVSTLAEIRAAKALLAGVKAELDDEAMPYDPELPLGIMIETPAAAIMSDVLAKEVDFFSIGTNDLEQFTLAMDRQNPGIDKYGDPGHEAVLRMIGMAVENGHREGIPVGVCGELAAETTLTNLFIELGVDSLSVLPSAILPLRKTIVELEEGI